MKLFLVLMGFTVFMIIAGCTMTTLGFVALGMHMIGWSLGAFIALIALDGLFYHVEGTSYIFDRC